MNRLSFLVHYCMYSGRAIVLVCYLLRMSSLCLTGSSAYSVESYRGKFNHNKLYFIKLFNYGNDQPVKSDQFVRFYLNYH